MNNVELLHAPQWVEDLGEWHMIVGNRTVAKITPNSGYPTLPHINWLSVIDRDYDNDDGWHAVDFETLEIAMHDLEQWWWHRCRGQTYRPNG